MKRLVLALLLSVAGAPAAAQTATLAFDQVRAGMQGTGRTVFRGTDVESFDVEILGKLPNIGPGQNLILARLSGGQLERTGVLAGMSGSPVIIDGKLVGAVAYTWGFSTEPIAGITPADEMLALMSVERDGARRASGLNLPRDLELLLRPERLRAFVSELESRVWGAGLTPAVPLSVGGIDVRALNRVLPQLARAGLIPIQAGPAGDADEDHAPPLEPGSAMGLKLVRGDVDLTATGTVTWVEDDRVLGFGHPLFGLGSIDLPLTAARVEAVLPSLYQSLRIARPLEEVGALRQDRSAGVLGQLGVRPSMIPVRLMLTGADRVEHPFAFDIADDPLLSPLLLYVSLNGILASKERAYGSATIRLAPGSVIKMADGEDVQLDNLFAGPTAFEYGTGLPAYILYLLMNNAWTQPQIAGVNLLLEYREAPRTARIRRAALDRYRVEPGDTIGVTVVLSPYRGPEQLLEREIVVPPETPPGKITVTIGGALAVTRDLDDEGPVLPRDLDQLIWLINQLRRNDRVYILASREDNGVLLGGARMPGLPPSVARVLSRPRSSGNFARIPVRNILEEVVLTDYAIEGSVTIGLEVEVH